MALQLGALRDALIDAGARPEIAERAAEEVAAHRSRQTRRREVLYGARNDFARVDARFARTCPQFTRIDGSFARLDAMMVVLIALVAAVLLFIH